MKLRVGLVWAAIALGVLVVAIAWQPQVPAPAAAQGYESPAPSSAGERVCVVVELFTSEGCSSCPPADALLARLVKTQPVPGAEIIALKEHVDYWDHLGWRDPFASSLFTERQQVYAQLFGNNSVYTPQMIVDGRAEFVGSAESRARQAIVQAARAPKTAVRLEWAAPGSAGLRVRVEQLRAAAGDTAEVYLAITEDNLHSDVARGENAGRSLNHTAVVRRLQHLGQADAQATTAFSAEPALAVGDGWKRKDLRAVVFVQERRSRRVLGAASIPFKQ